jgi:hypothetical protein
VGKSGPTKKGEIKLIVVRKKLLVSVDPDDAMICGSDEIS